MTMNATIFAAAAALCVTTSTAWASDNGILACQIGVTQFAEDIYGSKANLRAGQVAAAADLVELSRSQCRSSPGIVNANITAARQQLSLATGRRAGSRFDDFWPASNEELSMLTK